MGAKTSPWFEPQSLNPLIELPKTPLTAFTILSFALGIASVAPEAKGAQMALLLGSDVAGLLASSSNSNNQSSTPLPLNSNLPLQIQNELNAAYQALLNLNGDRTNRIL